MNEEIETCPDCNAVYYGNLFCNTCISHYENKFGTSEFVTMLKEINEKNKQKEATEWNASQVKDDHNE